MKKMLLFLLCLLVMTTGAHAAQLNTVAAVVNGKIITMLDLQKAALPDLARARLNPNDPKQSKQVNEVLRKALDNLIINMLVEQEAKRLEVTVSDSEVDQELINIMKERRLTRDQFEAQLKRQGLTLAELRETFKSNIMRQKIMRMQVGRKVVVTPEEIKAYYNKHKDELFLRDGLHMGLIVYHPNTNAGSIAAQIKSGKLSFAEAVRKYSVGPNKDKGGDMGPVEWDKLNPEWSERLNGMRPGDVTPPFVIQKNIKAQVMLFRPGATGPDKPLTLEEATPQIDAILRQPKAMERFEDYIGQLRSRAVIDIRL